MFSKMHLSPPPPLAMNLLSLFIVASAVCGRECLVLVSLCTGSTSCLSSFSIISMRGPVVMYYLYYCCHAVVTCTLT